MAPAPSRLANLPAEIICLIARCRLDDDIPAVGVRGLLLEDSYVSALRDWRAPIELHRTSPLCTPHACCFTRRGARSGQALTCYKDDFGPARSALDLLEVCSRIRNILKADHMFCGKVLLLRSSLIDEAIDRAINCAHPRLSFTAQGGICLCALSWLIQNIEFVTRIDLALPSTNIDETDSPSHMISTELEEGAPHLQAVDLRFDWAHAHADAQQKSIIRLPAVRTCRLLNATFAIAGEALTSLFLAGEEAAFRWRRVDIFLLLRTCPNLETLALQMIFVDLEAMTQENLLEYPHAGLVSLPRLRYCMISDTLVEWVYASANIQSPNKVRVHADVILPMSRVPGYTSQEFQLSCEAAMVSHNLQNIAAGNPIMAVRIQPAAALDDRWTRWPEYLSLSFGDSIPSAMDFRDPVRQLSAGSLTVRNAALSLTAVETPWVHLGFGGPRCHIVIDVMLRGCANLGIRHVETLVVDATSPYECPEQWSEILTHLSAIRSIVIYGLRRFSSPIVLALARALAKAIFIVAEDEDQVLDLDETYACPSLQTVRLPDAQGGTHTTTIVTLNGLLIARHKSLRKRISWEV